MKTREEINRICQVVRNRNNETRIELLLEVLLDIRELLENQSVEIVGHNMTDKEYRDLFAHPATGGTEDLPET